MPRLRRRRRDTTTADESGGRVMLATKAIAPRRGWRGPAGGRAAHIERGAVYLGTTVQVAGLFPFVQAAGLPAQGVPIGPDLLTHELVCLDPPGWVGTLTSNPSIWVQGQPGAGKSAIVKRICLGLVGYGYALLCPGDVKGEPLTVRKAHVNLAAGESGRCSRDCAGGVCRGRGPAAMIRAWRNPWGDSFRRGCRSCGPNVGSP